jgi:hypothetical protein
MSFKLSDVLKESKMIANFASSEYVCKGAVGEAIMIGKSTYEVRMFLFQGYVPGKNFSEFVKESNLSNAEPQIFDNGYAKLHCFLQTAEQKSSGVYFLLSLRELDMSNYSW